MIDIDFLEKLVAIPSLSGQEDEVADFLVQQMHAWGFRACRDNAGNAVGELGNPHAAQHLVMVGHMDTVPGEIPVHRENGRLYGRGAVDAKGSLAAFVLAAAESAPHLGDDLHLTVIGAVEEESHGWGAHHLARTLPAPTWAIIGEPSGWDSITLGYKGILNLDYRLVQPGGHSAGETPSPTEQAVGFWNRVQNYAAEFNQDKKGRFYQLAPALRRINTSGDGLYDTVRMSIVVRLPPDFDSEAFKAQLENWSDGANLTFLSCDTAYASLDKNTPPVRALLRGIRAQNGQPHFKLKTGTSDMNVVGPAWGCPIIAYGPGDSSLDHTPQEHIELAEFTRSVQILTQALIALAGARPETVEKEKPIFSAAF